MNVFVPQLMANSILAGSYIAVMALGFSMVYGCAQFFNFAPGVVYTIGAYSGLVLLGKMGMPVSAGGFVALIICGFVGASLDIVIHRRLRARHSSPLMQMVASLGTYIVLQNVLSLSFGDDSKAFYSPDVKIGLSFAGALVTRIQLLNVAGCAFAVLSTWLLLRRSNAGLWIRMVANDADLATAVGVSTNRVICSVFVISSALAGLAGFLAALDARISPTMGMPVLMLAAVVTLGIGANSFGGVIGGALLMGFVQQGVIWTVGARWLNTGVFALLMLFLVLRPHGTQNQNERV